ncbi:Uncharacterised protein [Bordetella pertussis]|nr:Uncharacterised protein [Bordetella pertussis]CFP66240.1 Uncharacterised protein [Bordetella pertussis]CFW43003.1 Uncharacterised protein [Bordetella pertussis]
MSPFSNAAASGWSPWPTSASKAFSTSFRLSAALAGRARPL